MYVHAFFVEIEKQSRVSDAALCFVRRAKTKPPANSGQAHTGPLVQPKTEFRRFTKLAAGKARRKAGRQVRRTKHN